MNNFDDLRHERVKWNLELRKPCKKDNLMWNYWINYYHISWSKVLIIFNAWLIYFVFIVDIEQFLFSEVSWKHSQLIQHLHFEICCFIHCSNQIILMFIANYGGLMCLIKYIENCLFAASPKYQFNQRLIVFLLFQYL